MLHVKCLSLYVWCRILDLSDFGFTCQLLCLAEKWSSQIELPLAVWQEDFSAQRSFREAEKESRVLD